MCWVVLLLAKISVVDLHLFQITSWGENVKDEKSKSFSPSLLFLFSEGNYKEVPWTCVVKMTWKTILSPIKKVRVYHLWSKTKKKFQMWLIPATFFCLFFHLCLPFQNFPSSIWSWWGWQSHNPLFPKRRMTFDTHRQYWADNLPFQIRKSWFVAFAFVVSPTLLPWLPPQCPYGVTKCGTGERSMKLALLSPYKPTSSSHCQQAHPDFLDPSGHRNWSRIKYVHLNNTDRHHYRELVQMLWEGANTSLWVETVRNAWA